MSILAALLLTVASLPPDASGREHVGLATTFERGRVEREGDVVVLFTPLDPAVHLNAEPAPRLRLDPTQRVLAEAAGPTPAAAREPFPNGRYLDPRVGVRFPVRLRPGATRGHHTVSGTLIYFYCSTSEGWCRRAQDKVEVSLSIP